MSHFAWVSFTFLWGHTGRKGSLHVRISAHGEVDGELVCTQRGTRAKYECQICHIGFLAKRKTH